ncbi:MAG: Holliday junction resolvase-like protein [archaeon]
MFFDLSFLVIPLIVLTVILILLLIYFFKKSSFFQEQFKELKFLKQSQSVKYGQMAEQFIPFSKDFPFDTSNFKFLGQPVDGIAFEKNKIVFCEFKTNKSKLSEKQRNIKRLVKDKEVEWFEYRIE